MKKSIFFLCLILILTMIPSDYVSAKTSKPYKETDLVTPIKVNSKKGFYKQLEQAALSKQTTLHVYSTKIDLKKYAFDLLRDLNYSVLFRKGFKATFTSIEYVGNSAAITMEYTEIHESFDFKKATKLSSQNKFNELVKMNAMKKNQYFFILIKDTTKLSLKKALLTVNTEELNKLGYQISKIEKNGHSTASFVSIIRIDLTYEGVNQ